MKYCYSLIFLFLLSLAACDKEDPAPVKTPQEVVNEEVFEAVAAESDLTEFAEAFKALELKAEEVESGITVFAPANDNTGGRMTSAQEDALELTPELLKSHIVKGLIDALGLEDGDILKALDGKDLIVSVDGDEIRINGVLISSKDLAKGEKYIIHKVETIIGEYVAEEPASLTITVYNSLLWSTGNPQGLPEAGVTVSFYTSPEDYVDGDAVYQAETDQAGKVTFADAQVGTTYYVLAQKGDISNVFYRSSTPVNGVHVAFYADGIFQSVEEISNSPVIQSGAAPGNIRFQDLNGDGIINNDDRGAVPHPQMVAAAGNTEVTVLIGYDNNDTMFIRDGADAQATFTAVVARNNSLYKTAVMMDGILSDDADCQAGTSWCAIDNFDYIASDALVKRLWDLAYSNIATINLILRDVPALTFDGKSELIANAQALRAVAYLQLATYFGDVPILDGVAFGEAQSRNQVTEVYALVTADLEQARTVLPEAPATDRSVLTKDAASILLARVALLKRDFDRARVLTSEVIEGAGYQLSISAADVFSDNTNPEIIWDLSAGEYPEFTAYFLGRNVGPVIRLTEAYLINAEANIELDALEEGHMPLSIIRELLGFPTTATTTEEYRTELRATWKLAMSHEGDRFRNLVRWQLAESTLGPKGFQSPKHNLLPIPQVVIDQHFNMLQNPGY